MLKKILLIDNDQYFVEPSALFLQEKGYEVDTLSGKEAAIIRLENYEPDIILLDIMTPLMDGLKLCRQIKSIDDLRDIPVIIMSAQKRAEYKKAAYAAKADDFIVKPFEYQELLVKIKIRLAVRAGYFKQLMNV